MRKFLASGPGRALLAAIAMMFAGGGVALVVSGSNPTLGDEIFSIVTEINEQGTTVLLVEQNAAQALKRAHRAYVLETGRVIKTAAAKDLLEDDDVKLLGRFIVNDVVNHVFSSPTPAEPIWRAVLLPSEPRSALVYAS